ncbi:hypothetical protein ACJMK2_035107 [Sinanodonta woodiana]|uniref:Amine oxidase domain-containing protein n=1 Tax=Sinanodonta woodiana TaxID=1069815 RepID=A0ABD3WVA2_SINWO
MLKRMVDNVLVVGAGMTGASVASFLKEDFKQTLKLIMWDKAKGTGGRMSTSRCSKDGKCTVDLGAQYISATPEYLQKHASHYEELMASGLLKPMTAVIEGQKDGTKDIKHYVTPKGVSSLVKHYIQKADPELHLDHHIQKIDIETGSPSKIYVTTQTGSCQAFSALVLTVPVPQILQLQGNIQHLIASQKEVKQNLENVTYSSRFALGLFYQPGVDLNYPWSAKYVTDNSCIRFVSIDNRKRGVESPHIGPSLCVHTSVPFGIQNVEEDKEKVKAVIIEHLKEVLPDLSDPIEVKSQKWRYSQVQNSYTGSPGCVVLSENPPLILAGDAFSHSNFDGCIESAIAVRQALSDLLKSKNS